MRILALDTSGFAGSVALLKGPRVLAEETLERQRRSAQTLAPAIARLLAGQRMEAREIGLVATTVGPGSFTGLRVGVTTAKTMAYVAGAEVVGLSTLEVVANQTPKEMLADGPREVQAVLDAQRKELFVGRFQAEADSELRRLETDRIVAIEAWLQSLRAGTLVTGSGLEKVIDRLPKEVVVVPPSHWEPRAATVGRLGWREYERGQRADVWKLMPVYLRPSYAEEKAARK